MFQATRAVSRLEGRGHVLGGWPATGSPNGRARGGPAYRAAAWLSTEKQSWAHY